MFAKSFRASTPKLADLDSAGLCNNAHTCHMELVEESPDTRRYSLRETISAKRLPAVAHRNDVKQMQRSLRTRTTKSGWPRDPLVSNRKIIPAHAALLATFRRKSEA